MAVDLEKIKGKAELIKCYFELMFKEWRPGSMDRLTLHVCEGKTCMAAIKEIIAEVDKADNAGPADAWEQLNNAERDLYRAFEKVESAISAAKRMVA